MKKLFAGVFLAASSLPLGFIAGVLGFHVLGVSWPESIQVAAKVTASVLGLGLFVLMSGLVSKVETPKPVSSREEWSKQ